MAFDQPSPEIRLTEPIFRKERDELIGLLKLLSPEEIKKLMNVNRQQAELEFTHICHFGTKSAPGSASAFPYNGIAFKGLDFSSLSLEDMAYAQEHVLIESAVYGFLRPLDKISPYRLEMQAKLENPKGKNLYEYWTERLTGYLSKRLKKDDKIWLDLSSEEYSKAIIRNNLPAKTRVITPQFREESADGYRQVVVHTKKARGMMARFVIQNRISDIEGLNAFDTGGYYFAEHLSSESEPVFIR